MSPFGRGALVLSAVCLAALSLHLWQVSATRRHDEEVLIGKFDQVRVGMTLDEVDAILGPSPYPSSECAMHWTSGRKEVQIEFDLDWRVREKECFDELRSLSLADLLSEGL